MKTIVTFKALANTRARDEDGIKVTVKKGKTFKTTEANASIYRGYKKLFEEVNVEYAQPKKDKNTIKNSDAFPVTISDEMKNEDIEKLLTKIGAKFKKKGSRKELVKAYNETIEEDKEMIALEKEEKATETFKNMIDNRTLDQLEELVDDMEKALSIDGINKKVCKEYITEAYDTALEKKGEEGKADEDGNSEGSLDGADAGDVDGKEGTENGADSDK